MFSKIFLISNLKCKLKQNVTFCPSDFVQMKKIFIYIQCCKGYGGKDTYSLAGV